MSVFAGRAVRIVVAKRCHVCLLGLAVVVLVAVLPTVNGFGLNTFDTVASRRTHVIHSIDHGNGRRRRRDLPPTVLDIMMAGDPEESLNNDNDNDNVMKKKETTWDRITGPKLFKTVTNWQGIHSVPLVPLRILTGLLMIHHGSEGGVGPANFGTAEFDGFVQYVLQPHFGFLPGPLEWWSAIHDYVEFGGGILFALGFLTRPAALSLLVTMMSAIYFHLSSVGAQGFPLGHVPNYSYDFEEPLLYALIFLMFWFNGAGPLSVDSIIYKNIAPEDSADATN